jgi:MFS family permease
MKRFFTQYRGLSRSAYILFFARLVTTMGSFIWPMMTLILSTKLGYSGSEIATIFVVISLVFVPGTILGGKLADVFDKKKIIVVFDIITVTFFFLAASVEPGMSMLVFFVIAGLFATMEGPAHEALTIEISLPKDREKIFSLMYLGFNLGFIFGAMLGGFLIANYLSLAFIIDGITTLLSTVLIVLFVFPVAQDAVKEEDKNEYEDKAEDHETAVDIVRSRKPIMIQLIIIVFMGFIYDQWAFLIPLHMASLFGEVDGPLYFGFLSSFNGFIVIVATPLLTVALAKLFEIPKLILGTSIYAGSFLILLIAPELPIFFIFILFFTLAEVTNMLGSSPYFSRRVPSSHRGRINSYQNIGYMAGSLVGRLATGFIVDYYGFNWAYFLVFLLLLIVVGINVYNYRVDKKVFPKLYIREITQEES